MKFILKSFFVFLMLFVGFVNISQAATTQHTCHYDSAQTDCVDMKGYAWGADSKPFGGAGWINFNNTDSGSKTNKNGAASYHVEFDRGDLSLHGYAYSENYGYIKFGGFTEGSGNYPVGAACEGGTNTGSDADKNCNAHLVAVSGGYELVGYARFCFVYQSGCSGNIRPDYELGGYDGWIAFKGSNFAVTYNTSNVFQSYAWGGGSGVRGNSNYAKGMGWILTNPKGGGLSCYVEGVDTANDCISDSSDRPIVNVYTENGVNPVKYNTTFTLKWSISNIPNGCTAKLTSTPTNSGWDNHDIWDNSSINDKQVSSGSYTVTGGVSEDTTFKLECTYANEKGNDSEIITLNKFTPIVTLTPTSSITYGESVNLTYNVTNIPFGCTGQLYKEGVAQGDPITNMPGDGTNTKEYTGTITETPLTTTNWEFRCTDTTPPTPNRVGSGTAKTTVVVPTPIVSLVAKSIDTNSTINIPCTNTGVELTYSTRDVKTGSCKAMYIPFGAGSSRSLSGWDSGTTITENDYPTTHTSTTGSITDTGSNIFYLQCKKLDGTPWTGGKALTRSCTTGSLSVTGPSCITPPEMLNISYVGSGFDSGSCEMSWRSSPNNKINTTAPSHSFNSNYVYPASNLTVGNTYTYTVSGCQESSYPSNPPMSSSVTVEVKNDCGPGTNPRNAPKFKEQ